MTKKKTDTSASCAPASCAPASRTSAPDTHTDITVVLDASGSMASVLDETIDGFNKFLAEQKETPGKATMTVVRFNTEYSVLYSGVDIKDAEPLTRSTFAPNSGTALLDAMGKTIADVTTRLASLGKADIQPRVIMVVMTDGAENSSREFKKEVVEKLVRDKTEKDGWTFAFLGANMDAIQAGAAIGMVANSVGYASNTAGVASAYGAMSHAIKTARCSSKADYGVLRSNLFNGAKKV